MAVLSLLVHICGHAQIQGARPPQQQQLTAEQAEKLRRAEEVADRFVQRLHETLDYGVPFRELFVRSPELRSKSNMLFGPDAESEQLFGKGVVERFHIAFMNVWYLRNVYCIARKVDFQKLPKKIKALGGGEFFPGLEGLNLRGVKSAAEIKRKMERLIARLNHLAAMLRQHLPANVFDLPAFKSKIEPEREASRQKGKFARVEYESSFVELPKDVPVYVVTREFLGYYLIEEGSELRVIGIHILPGFRWPGL
jgi:hypothetical protein